MVDSQGEKFKNYLQENGIGVTQAASKLGVSRQTIYQYFKTSRFEPETVSIFIDAFGPGIAEIFNIKRQSNDVDALKDEIIRLQGEAIEREREIIRLQSLLLDKSLSPNKDIVNDKL